MVRIFQLMFHLYLKQDHFYNYKRCKNLKYLRILGILVNINGNAKYCSHHKYYKLHMCTLYKQFHLIHRNSNLLRILYIFLYLFHFHHFVGHIHLRIHRKTLNFHSMYYNFLGIWHISLCFHHLHQDKDHIPNSIYCIF